MARILVVDDEDGIRAFAAECLELAGHDVRQAASGEDALVAIRARNFDLVMTDLRMPGIDGIELIETAHAEQPELQFIVLTAHADVDTAVRAMKLGAFDYVQKPVSGPAELRLMAERALERRTLVDLKERTKPSTDAPPLGYGDPAMAGVVSQIEKVAKTKATVLLRGESGTGKEVAAREIHRLSGRAAGPFVAVNCAVLSANLLESELFGHEKGAFTGAGARKRGRIELADGGSFFLDEVGELEPALQAKLLRVVQERTFERVGGTQTIEVDVRWIAATNRNLREQITAGSFREDLYHRLAVFPVDLPALRDRPADIIPLAERLLARISADLHVAPLTLDDTAKKRLVSASWSGNIRELANVLERAAILAEGNVIDASALWIESADVGVDSGVVEPLVDLEKRAIVRALAQVEGNRKQAAELLGIGVRTLYDKIKRYDLD